jgi:hypothetical protein
MPHEGYAPDCRHGKRLRFRWEVAVAIAFAVAFEVGVAFAVAVAVAVQLPVERAVPAMPEADKVRRQ